MNEITIAIIVSRNEDACRYFMKRYQLNPACFKIVTRHDKLHGINRQIPIIVIDAGRSIDSEMRKFIEHRFASVRYMELG